MNGKLVPWAPPQEEQSTTTQLVPWANQPQEPKQLVPWAQPEQTKTTSPFDALEKKLTSYGRGLTKEDFMSDPELMDMVRDNMRTRYQDSNIIASGVTGALGGATGRGWETMSDDELFETWQNYHRSFAGGQTVTTMNEVAYAATVDEQLKAKLGLGYKLFDSMDNAFVGEGTWGESFDAVGDYMAAAIWDPTTVLSLGVGRAFTAGGAKAAGQALRMSAQAAMKAEFKKQISAGVPKEVAKQAAVATRNVALEKGFKQVGKTTAKKQAVAMGGVDLVQSVGTDVLYQDTLIKTGAQDEYSVSQTALSALGAIATPALVEAGKLGAKSIENLSKSLGSDIFVRYQGFKNQTVGKDRKVLTEEMKKRVDVSQINKNLRQSFQDFDDNKEAMLGWSDSKAASDDVLKEAGLTTAVNRDEANFFNTFLMGSGKVKGLVPELRDAGFVFVPRTPDDKISNWVGDAISWLDGDVVKKAVETFEKQQGVRLGIGYDPQTVAASFKKGASDAGYRLLLSQRVGRMLDSNSNDLEFDYDGIIKAFQEENAPIKEEDLPARFAYMQSVWKRLVTAHPGTTGLNIKGWGQLSLMNTVSDMVLGGLNFGNAGFKAVTGDFEGAKYYVKQGKGTILGSLKRGYALMDYNATLDEALAMMDTNPKLFEELFRQGAGDTGTLNALPSYNMDVNNPVNKATEGVVRTAQQLSGVILQDEVTKMLSYMPNVDRAIMREYGQSYNEFMARPDRDIEMASKRFLANVHAPALDRTLRETASKSWSTKKGQSISLYMAKGIEHLSNNAVSGYAIPFGRFFNTAMSTFGDYSSLNFFRQLMKKATGQNIDAMQDETGELLAKGIVGVTGVMLLSDMSMEKIKEGLAWNQERRDDGSISDKTYDFPESFFRSFAQLIGHYRLDGEVPEDLADTVYSHIVGQTFRATEEGVAAAKELATSFIKGDIGGIEQQGSKMIIDFFSGILSGVTRPLDPINQGAGMLTGDYAVPDRRQGYEFWNQSTRYIDKIFNFADLPDRAYPTRGTQVTPDLGKVLGGVRSTPEVNDAESILNSVGKESWKAFKWEGPPEVKNRMDELVAPIFNAYARQALKQNPEFFTMSLKDRQNIVTGVIEKSRTATKAALKSKVGQDETFAVINAITSDPNGTEKKIRQVLDKVAPGMKLSDIAAMEGGKEKLQTILYMLKNWDTIDLE